MLERAGRIVVTLLASAGAVAVFAFRALKELFIPPFEFRETVRQLFELGLRSAPLIAVSGVAVGVVLWMLLAGEPSAPTTVGCGLILGGAAGNLLDRLSTGEVTDYVHFSFWYIFNAADAAITVGVVLLILSALWPEGTARPSTLEDKRE